MLVRGADKHLSTIILEIAGSVFQPFTQAPAMGWSSNMVRSVYATGVLDSTQAKDYQRIRAEPQVNPDPNAARQTRSPSLILPASQASESAMGIEAAVVLPYRWMLFQT